MKCDLHVHSWHSGPCDSRLLSRFCRESYTDPEELHRLLRRQGMDLVTITGHDSIDGAGRGRVCGPSGGYAKLTREVLQLAAEAAEETWAAALLSPLALALPAATLLNYLREIAFSYRWTSRVIDKYSRRCRPLEILASPALGEEA